MSHYTIHIIQLLQSGGINYPRCRGFVSAMLVKEGFNYIMGEKYFRCNCIQDILVELQGAHECNIAVGPVALIERLGVSQN